MPEIVEAKKYCDFIKQHLDIVTGINIRGGRYKKHGPFTGFTDLQSVLPVAISSVDTKSKLTWITFANGYKLLVTLGLTGGWAYKPRGGVVQFPKIYDEMVAHEGPRRYQVIALKHLNVEFVTPRGSLFYYDMLSFGTMKLLKNDTELQKKLRTLGPDVMEPTTTFEVFKERFLLERIQQKPVGVVLLDQKIVSGIGNYLRADCLYLARVSPFRKVKDVTAGELKKLYRSIKEVTWGMYDIPHGRKLGYISTTAKFPKDYGRKFWVYNQDYDINGNTVTKQESYEGSQKRSIYWVKSIQK